MKTDRFSILVVMITTWLLLIFGILGVKAAYAAEPSIAVSMVLSTPIEPVAVFNTQPKMTDF